jgi:hypothetical protein
VITPEDAVQLVAERVRAQNPRLLDREVWMEVCRAIMGLGEYAHFYRLLREGEDKTEKPS